MHRFLGFIQPNTDNNLCLENTGQYNLFYIVQLKISSLTLFPLSRTLNVKENSILT